MRYRLSCLTPLLVGDGQKLSPIDYMVWKDQVNVLDQRRIFRLLSKGPRLEGYLAQLRKAEKLDFASWGGFAQNFADRRIPFEHGASSQYWERANRESLFIPTFASGASGPYLPGSAVKGALRTGVLAESMSAGALKELAERFQGERAPKRPAEHAETQALGGFGGCRMRLVGASDSAPISASAMRIYLLRVSALVARGPNHLELGWKQSPRGTVDGRRPEESTPVFAEMAAPGTTFQGRWQENGFLVEPEIARALGWRQPPSRAQMFEAANRYAAGQLALHKNYAQQARLGLLAASVEALEKRLEEARQAGACLLSMGWGGGFLSKVSPLKTDAEDYRAVLRQVPLYGRAIQTGLPFPKTRRIVFLNNQPATLPGWALLEVVEAAG